MKKEINRLTKTIVKLHQNFKSGKKNLGYKYFKEAMGEVLALEGKGISNGVTEKAKEILKEYYEFYQTKTEKDSTRVIVEAKSAEALEKKAQKQQKKQLKSWLKEVVNNVQHMRDAINKSEDSRVGFHAKQIKLAVDEILTMVGIGDVM